MLWVYKRVGWGAGQIGSMGTTGQVWCWSVPYESPTCHHSALFDSDALSPRTVEYQPPDSIARDPPHLHSTLHLFRFELIPNQILGWYDDIFKFLNIYFKYYYWFMILSIWASMNLLNFLWGVTKLGLEGISLQILIYYKSLWGEGKKNLKNTQKRKIKIWVLSTCFQLFRFFKLIFKF